MSSVITSFKDLAAQTKRAREAYWTLLDQAQAELAPRLAKFFTAIGLVEIEPFIDIQEDPCQALGLLWRFTDEDGEVYEATATFLGAGFLAALLDEPERCFDYDPGEVFKAEVLAAAKAQNLDLRAVAAYVGDHCGAITLKDGKVTLAEVIV